MCVYLNSYDYADRYDLKLNVHLLSCIIIDFAGDIHWTTSTYTALETCLVTGLKPETPYRLRVSAVNLLGRGPFSWSSVETTTLKQGT